MGLSHENVFNTTQQTVLSLDSSGAMLSNEDHFCKLILYIEIPSVRVQVWDLIMLVPNLIFLIFICVRFNRARLKLRATSSSIFIAFYGLVVTNVTISLLRCLVSMSMSATAVLGSYIDTILWVSVRFFLLFTEISVVIFGLAFGHLDSRSSIRHVLLATSLISLAFSCSQATLEVLNPDENFKIQGRDANLFGHGGMFFWFISSIVFTILYICILILPWTRVRERLALPTKKSFYIYILFLVLLNFAQSVGSGLLLYSYREGLCVVDVTTCLYFTLFTPLVYHTFLSEFFGVSQPSIMFSYKAQVDDGMEDDVVSLPHQHSFSSLKTDSDYIYQIMELAPEECGRMLTASKNAHSQSAVRTDDKWRRITFNNIAQHFFLMSFCVLCAFFCVPFQIVCSVYRSPWGRSWVKTYTTALSWTTGVWLIILYHYKARIVSPVTVWTVKPSTYQLTLNSNMEDSALLLNRSSCVLE